jgi:hypothetical protein
MKYLLVGMSFLAAGLAFAADRSSAPDGAYVYIISPAHGETVDADVLVRFGLSGMGIAPAGVERSGTGHHHLLIDMEELPSGDASMPASDKLIHFGKGQTEAMVSLTPGKHTLQLVLGNQNHVQHKPVVKSQKITVMVRPPKQAPATEKDHGGLPGLFR